MRKRLISNSNSLIGGVDVSEFDDISLRNIKYFHFGIVVDGVMDYFYDVPYPVDSTSSAEKADCYYGAIYNKLVANDYTTVYGDEWEEWGVRLTIGDELLFEFNQQSGTTPDCEVRGVEFIKNSPLSSNIDKEYIKNHNNMLLIFSKSIRYYDFWDDTKYTILKINYAIPMKITGSYSYYPDSGSLKIHRLSFTSYPSDSDMVDAYVKASGFTENIRTTSWYYGHFYQDRYRYGTPSLFIVNDNTGYNWGRLKMQELPDGMSLSITMMGVAEYADSYTEYLDMVM